MEQLHINTYFYLSSDSDVRLTCSSDANVDQVHGAIHAQILPFIIMVIISHAISAQVSIYASYLTNRPRSIDIINEWPVANRLIVDYKKTDRMIDLKNQACEES